jgi:hypothetical protein
VGISLLAVWHCAVKPQVQSMRVIPAFPQTLLPIVNCRSQQITDELIEWFSLVAGELPTLFE